jgi:lysophospholipase L1-like esterase
VGILAQMVMSSASGVGGAAPNVLLIAPAPLAPLRGLPFEDMFEGGEEKSRQFGHLYAAMAAQVGCAFLDAGSLIRSSLLDGIHLDPPEHRTLGLAVAAKVREIIG